MSFLPDTRRWMRALAAAGLIAVHTPATAEDGAVSIELNKLEAQKDACRAYLVFVNETSRAFAALKLDLVMFGTDGVIARRLAVEAAPLIAGKTTVKLFDIAGLACGDIGRVLLNDVMSCRDQGGERRDCVNLVATASRAKVPFVK